MIVVVAALKGGVGKTTTAVYLAALAAASRRSAVLVDADPQASSADWIEAAPDDQLELVTPVEAPTDRLLTRALSRIDGEEVAVVDTPPGNERLLAKAIDVADVVIVPARVGGVENARVEAVVGMVPINVPLGLVICSARPYTLDYQEAIATWSAAQVPLWGTVPERVSIASGPDSVLSADGLDAYRGVWRRAVRAVAREN
jgi:chromosome partitioning protein